ncbi:MAG: DUF5372 family protein [Acidobacteriota bacterium]|nr:DUF5372 family protein [Acidobacteriota bacterium]
MVHPFHPLRGRPLRMVVRKSLWGEDRVTIELTEGTHWSIPVGWTDLAVEDPYISLGAGRSFFRVRDLIELARLVSGGLR